MRLRAIMLMASLVGATACGSSSDRLPDGPRVDRPSGNPWSACDPQTYVCPTGTVCFASQVCPKGGTCGPQLGDLKCHAKCTTGGAECAPTGTSCQDVTLARGDTEETVKFCR